MDLGTRLKVLRKNNKLSQQKLAETLGMNRVTYSQYEINRRIPDIETLQKLAVFFDVSLDYLSGRTEDQTPNSKEIKYKTISSIDLDEEPDKIKLTFGQRELTLKQKQKLRLFVEQYLLDDEDDKQH